MVRSNKKNKSFHRKLVQKSFAIRDQISELDEGVQDTAKKLENLADEGEEWKNN